MIGSREDKEVTMVPQEDHTNILVLEDTTIRHMESQVDMVIMDNSMEATQILHIQ